MDILDIGRFGLEDNNFYIMRNGYKVDDLYANKKYIRNKLVIEFYKNVVQVGDVLVEFNNSCRYHVIDLQDVSDQLQSAVSMLTLHAYVLTDYEFNKQNTTNYHINAHSSIVNLNSPNSNLELSMSNFEKEVKKCAPEDVAICSELVEVLKSIQNGKTVKKHDLSKFTNLLNKYAPLAVSIGQLLVSILL